MVAAALAQAQLPAVPPGTSLVFFDWGKPELTGDAKAALDQVAAAYRLAPAAKVHLAGHTDRSGSATYNLRASRIRAETVRSYLVEHGVPTSAISVDAFGEARPIIPTEDGVREAQNRRVEIILRAADAGPPLSAPLVAADGSAIGSATLIESASGLRLAITASGLLPGPHGLHLHTIGRCEGPKFESAGPHWNPTGAKHGIRNPEGPHRGDLPNLPAGADGRARLTVAVPRDPLDADGFAVVSHAAADDHMTDPSGNSGARIACAAFVRQ